MDRKKRERETELLLHITIHLRIKIAQYVLFVVSKNFIKQINSKNLKRIYSNLRKYIVLRKVVKNDYYVFVHIVGLI